MAVFAVPVDFPPVFHIKLKDQVLLEGEAATLLCLPAACPAPHISWMKGKGVTSPPDRGIGKWPQGQGMFSGMPHSAAPPAPPLPPDKQSLRSEPSVVIVSCKDGRQLLSIPRAGKRHAGLYECSATNVLGSITSSCTVAVAREPGAGTEVGGDGGWMGPKLGQGLTGAPLVLPGIPGKLAPPEVPQTYQDTALVLWKPGDSRAPCTYTLERRVDGEEPAGSGGRGRAEKLGRQVPSLGKHPSLTRLLTDGTGSLGHPFSGLSPSSMLPIGESSWHPVSSGIPDCYYNVTHLPVGVTMRFRVACANRAGQGPFSNPSEKVLVRGVQGQCNRVGGGQRGQGTLRPGSGPS